MKIFNVIYSKKGIYIYIFIFIIYYMPVLLKQKSYRI